MTSFRLASNTAASFGSSTCRRPPLAPAASVTHPCCPYSHSICSRNPTAHFIARAYYAGILVGALYCFSGGATEWHEGGKLVGFSVLVKQGQYGVGTVFATTSSAARKGVWAQNLVGQYERLLEGGSDADISLFDSGPTLGGQKNMWGLQALDRQRIIRMLFTGR